MSFKSCHIVGCLQKESTQLALLFRNSKRLKGYRHTFHVAEFPKEREQCTKCLTVETALLFVFKELEGKGT